MSGGISSTRWKTIRRLLHTRGRAAAGKVLVEGARAVFTLLERVIPPEAVLVGPATSPRLDAVLQRAVGVGLQPLSLSEEQAEELSSTAHGQQIFAVLTWQPETGSPNQLPEFLLHLSGIRNPANMGALLRSAAAFGATVTCSRDCVDVTHPVAVRSGAAAYFDLALRTDVDLHELRAAEPDRALAYASSTGGAELADFTWPERMTLVVGGEADGATEPLTGALRLHIPQQIESLNAAVAGGILLWEARRQGAIRT
jgi:TrmH family RNA methyltransferase